MGGSHSGNGITAAEEAVIVVKDLTIRCQDCGTDFIHGVEDQLFYEMKGYLPPKRCRHCRRLKATLRT